MTTDRATLPPGVDYLAGCLDLAQQVSLLGDIRRVLTLAPFFRPTMPRTGRAMSVVMTNCGPLGWVTDQAHGYRYQMTHPASGEPWPPIPESLLGLWHRVARCSILPEACLVNFYTASAKMGSHQDRDEETFAAPVVSVSLGDFAVFHVGGQRRSDPKIRLTLHSGDVVVLGGASRTAFHGIDRVLSGTSDLLAEGGRINLTLRRVTAGRTS